MGRHTGNREVVQQLQNSPQACKPLTHCLADLCLPLKSSVCA
jgi:hypothetical protein